MSAREDFINSVEKCIENYPNEFNENAISYFENFCFTYSKHYFIFH